MPAGHGILPPDDGCRRAAQSRVGLQAALREFVDEAARAGYEWHSLMLYHAGAVIAERWWWPYGPARLHSMHSATKGFTAAGVGLAVAEGRFSLADKVADFFPDRLRAPVSDNLAAMTVADLLTQRSGHETSVSGSLWRSVRTSWVDEFFKIPVACRPGAKFVYSSATSFLLSAIVTKTTGQSLHAYMRPRFFSPLGMRHVRWDVGPEGINPGGNGISCTTADLLKLGIVHLQDGAWNGRQVLDPAWVRLAVADVHGDGYGYHWWIGPGQRSYFAFGAFGQYVFVFPDHDAVLAVTGATDLLDGRLRPVVFRHFPALFDGAPATGAGRARQLPPALRLLQPVDCHGSPRAAAVSGQRYLVGPNDDGVREVRLDFEAERCIFTLTDGRGTHQVVAGLRDWAEGWTTMSGAALHHGYEPGRMRVVASGTWVDDDTFRMTWQFAETPFRDTVVIRFAPPWMRLERSVNVSSGTTKRPALQGAAISADPGPRPPEFLNEGE